MNDLGIAASRHVTKARSVALLMGTAAALAGGLAACSGDSESPGGAAAPTSDVAGGSVVTNPTSSSDAVTGIAPGRDVGTLSPAEQQQLCDDAKAYYAAHVSPEVVNKIDCAIAASIAGAIAAAFGQDGNAVCQKCCRARCVIRSSPG